MKYYLKQITCIVASAIICWQCESNRKNYHPVVPNIESVDIEHFIRFHLVQGIKQAYQKIYSGYREDHFAVFKKKMQTEYPFFFGDTIVDWDTFLSQIPPFLNERQSHYKLRYHLLRFSDKITLPTATLYETIKTANEFPPLNKMSEFWGIDFVGTFREGTTFKIEYAKQPLLLRYDLWIQQKQQKIILEGITYTDTDDIIIFADKDHLEESLIHELSHKIFQKNIQHLSDEELMSAELHIEQAFKGGAKTTIVFNYHEFDELIAKLSELIVIPDSELFDFIHEVYINTNPQMQMARQLITHTTVYKYLAEEHPDIFLQFKNQELVDVDIDQYLFQMAHDRTKDGKNKLRSYLMFHVNSLKENLKDIVFEEIEKPIII